MQGNVSQFITNLPVSIGGTNKERASQRKVLGVAISATRLTRGSSLIKKPSNSTGVLLRGLCVKRWLIVAFGTSSIAYP